MKILIYISLILFLGSCSAPKLYQQGLDKIEKAIQKDPTLTFPKDTLTVIEYDTIRGVDGKDSIINIKETITIPCDFDVEKLTESMSQKSRKELRHERKVLRESLMQERRLFRLETKRLNDSLRYEKSFNKDLSKRIKDLNNTNVKLAKEKTKQERGSWFTRLVGRFWWIVLIIGIIIGVYLKGFILGIPSFFKRK